MAGGPHCIEADGYDGEAHPRNGEGDIGYPVSERLLGHVPYLSCLLSLGDWTFFAIREALKEMRRVDIRVGAKFRVAARGAAAGSLLFALFVFPREITPSGTREICFFYCLCCRMALFDRYPPFWGSAIAGGLKFIELRLIVV